MRAAVLLFLFCVQAQALDHSQIREFIISQQQKVVGTGATLWIGDSIIESVYWNQACGSVINGGLAGATIGQIADKMPFWLSLRPSYVVLWAGVNDAYVGTGTPPEQFQNTYAGVVQTLRANGISTALVTILPVELSTSQNYSIDYINSYNKSIRAIGKNLGIPVVDAAPNWTSPNGYMYPGWSYDGVHPLAKTGSSQMHMIYAHLKDATGKARKVICN